MKKVSAKMFFTVLWSGVCQAVKWFFGLFPYSKDPKSQEEKQVQERREPKENQGESNKSKSGGKPVAVVVTVAAVIAVGFIIGYAEEWYEDFRYQFHFGKKLEDPWNLYVYDSIYFHENEHGRGYLYNGYTGRKTLKKVEYVDRETLWEEPLALFSDGKKYGYFNKRTGRLAVAPQYDNAYAFSEGRACVNKGSFVCFIDSNGKEVLNTGLKFVEAGDDAYLFHGGHCVVYADDEEHVGLIDTTGTLVFPTVFDQIGYEDEFWLMEREDSSALCDLGLHTIIPMTEGRIEIDSYEKIIGVVSPDHLVSKYDFEGKILYDFCISSVRMLEYEKEEVKAEVSVIDGINGPVVHQGIYHPKATARLRVYVSDRHEGLITAEGQMVTKPLYLGIHAIGYDLYCCEMDDGCYAYSVLVNGKGEVIGRKKID